MNVPEGYIMPDADTLSNSKENSRVNIAGLGDTALLLGFDARDNMFFITTYAPKRNTCIVTPMSREQFEELTCKMIDML